MNEKLLDYGVNLIPAVFIFVMKLYLLLIYKAKQNPSTVIKVDPASTSQCCPKCGHIEQANRNKKKHLFTCKNCGYQSNGDHIGAMNLYRMGINYLVDSQVPSAVTTE